jgi:hypothetical protein
VKEEGEEDDDEEEEGAAKRKSRAKSVQGKGRKEVTFSKFTLNKCNPLITKISDFSTQFEGTSSQFDTSCCVRCSNKELIRALKINNLKLFK